MPPKKRRGANDHGGETRAKAAPQADDSRSRGASPALLLGGAVVVCGAAMLFLGPEQGGGSAKAARQKAVAVNYIRHEVEPARIGLAEWSASSYVEQVDFEAPGAPEAIKARAPPRQCPPSPVRHGPWAVRRGRNLMAAVCSLEASSMASLTLTS